MTWHLNLLLASALLLSFVQIANAVVEGGQLSMDERLLLAMREEGSRTDPVGPTWLEEAMRDLTVLGGVVVVTLVTVVTLGFLLMLGEYRVALVVLLAVTTGGLASTLLKTAIGRPRPSVVEAVVTSGGLSFPSGHSLISAIIYPMLGALLTRVVPRRRAQAYIVGVSLSLTGVIGFSRVYLGVHYPSDVLAGWTLGLALSLLAWNALRRLQRRGLVESGPRTP